MKRIVLLGLLLFLPLMLSAQDKRLVVRQFSNSDLGDMRARTSPVMDRNNRLSAMVEVSFSAPDSISFEGILGEPLHLAETWIVRVPEGSTRMKIFVPGCKPLDFTFPEKMLPESGRVYLLDLALESTTKLRTLILPSFSYNSAQTSFGLMLGFCKKNGLFIHAKTDFTFGINPTVDCDAEGRVNGVKGWFTGESTSSRLAFTAGYLRQLFSTAHNSSMFAYAGGGFGSRILAWKMYGMDSDYEYARVLPSSFTGYEVDAGFIYRLGGFALSAGIQTNQFKYVEANVGIGVMF